MKTNLWTIAALGLVGCAAASAVAVPQQPAQAAFSDTEFSQIARLMTGSWKAKGVKAGEGTADIVLSIAPITMKDMPDVMYAEVARAEAIEAPYRQTIMQFHKEGGKTHLRTYEFGTPHGEVMSIRTIWAAPEAFPAEVTSSMLVPTTDVEFSGAGTSFHGASSHSHTGSGGAAEVTSEVEVTTSALKLADRGLAADGSVVWGPAKGEWTSFERASTGVSTNRMGDGLIVINYPYELKSDKTPKNDDIIFAQYIGTVGDGTVFDASYQRGTPYRYRYDGIILDGWKRAMTDARPGMKRKLIIPGAMGLKEAGYPSKGVGPNATLYFQLEILDIQEQPKTEQLPPVEIKPDEPAKPLEFKPGKIEEKQDEKHDHPH